MKSVFYLGMAFCLGVLNLTANAAEDPACPELHIQSGALTLNQMPSRTANRCLVTVSPYTQDGVYRSYCATASGSFLVFNAFGEGPNSTATGSRHYFLFPRQGYPSIEVLSHGDAALRAASGQVLRLSKEQGRVLEISGKDADTQFVEAPRVDRDNQGGLELTRYPGILVDCGWTLGGSACNRLERQSTVRDPNGLSCKIANKDLFDTSNQSLAFRFVKDADFAAFLKRRCPRLDVSSLLLM